MSNDNTRKIIIPRLHERQLQISKSNAKRKVLLSGRRGGKTTLAAIEACKYAMDGKRILFAAPKLDQVESFWAVCNEVFGELIDVGGIYRNETKHLIKLPKFHNEGGGPIGGGRIRAKTAHDADTLRGDYADILMLEEFAYMDYDAWGKVGAPMLLDNDGDAWFLSTANGQRNHFFKLYSRALTDDTGRWEAFMFTSYANPYLSEEALAEITGDMTDADYRQEIMCEFLEGEGAVFRNIDKCTRAEKSHPGKHRGHKVVVGIDWGQSNDPTAVSIFCADCNQELAIDRFKGIPYADMRMRIKAMCQRWGVQSGYAETNAMGQPNLEMLQSDGVPISGFTTTSQTKGALVKGLQLSFEQEEAQWLDDPVATSELQAYQATQSERTGAWTYSAPTGMHDDTIIARALAKMASNESAFPFAVANME